MSHRRLLSLIAVLPALFGPPGFASSISVPHDPATYRSRSGQYVLDVDPSQRDGVGPAACRMTKGGLHVWARTLPFTLSQAVLTDSGLAAGIAYTQDGPHPGEMRTVFLDGKGAIAHQESEPRRPSRFLDTGPDPVVSGLVLQEDQDRVIVRVADPDLNRKSEEWRVYRMSDAKRISTVHPKQNLSHIRNLGSPMVVRPIAGTPLLLTQWSVYDNSLGSVFTLLDRDAQPIWELVLRNDYATRDDQLTDAIWSGAAILSTDEPRRFEIWQVVEGKRVTYEITPPTAASAEWNVHSIREQDHVLPPPASRPAEVALPQTTLEFLGTIALDSRAGPRSPIRGIRQFTLDRSGRALFVRDDREQLTMVSVELSTGIVHETALSKQRSAKPGRFMIACTEQSRYVLVLEEYEQTRAWWCDKDGRMEPIALPEPLQVRSLAALPDGGFVVLGTRCGEHAGEDIVLAFDRRGEELWSVGAGHPDPSKLFGPQDLAANSLGRVGVLSSSGHRIQLYSADGKHLGNMDLKESMGTNRYPTEIQPDGADGWWVYDSGDKVFRVRPGEGKSEAIRPMYADGRGFRPQEGIQVAPDGTLWTSDGENLLRLDRKGRVDRILGDPPDPDRLDEIRAFTVDGEGRMYAVADRTSSVHVFDRHGRPLRVLRPEPTDFSLDSPADYVAVAENGSVHVGNSFAGGHVVFSAQGRRLGPSSFLKDGMRELRFAPRSNGPWAWGLDAITILNDTGQIVRRIERAPDNKWLRNIWTVALNGKGDALVLTEGMLSDRQSRVLTYNRDGEPVGMFDLPTDMAFELAVGDTHLFVSTAADTILMATLDGKTMVELKVPPPTRPRSGKLILGPDRQEIWLLVSEQRTIYRYRLPA